MHKPPLNTRSRRLTITWGENSGETMIEKNVKIHDKFQFEIKLGYKIKRKQEKTDYDIEAYFFIPNNLGLDRYTYSKADFYQDIHSYIRLKTPTMLLRQITEANGSPIAELHQSMDELLVKRDRDSHENYEYHVKMLCSIVKSALRDHVEFAEKSSPNDINDLLETFISGSKQVTEAYRDLKPVIMVPTVNEKSISIYRFGDEFLSQNIELYSFHLLKWIDNQNDNTPFSAIREKLASQIREEYKYRRTLNYQSSLDTAYESEMLIYRRGVLKKYIGSALFLDTRREKEGRLIEQTLLGIAAGLSMVFATMVAFYAQKHFGTFTMPVFTALVVSYIFKDRIKELSRIYFLNKFRQFGFDHKTDIFGDSRKKIGTCKEAVSFVEENEIPHRIKTIRGRGPIADVENRWRGEKVIFYRKQVTLFSKRLEEVYRGFNIEGVNDIIRFNVQRFLTKMDNPSRKIYILQDNAVGEINADRVYHVNLVLTISREEKTFYKRVRIILNRNGISRIEEIDMES
jgi:hypothetical protein